MKREYLTEYEHSKRDRVLSLVFIVLVVGAVIAWYLSSKCTATGHIRFEYIQNRNTGEDSGIIVSLLLYVLLSWLCTFFVMFASLLPVFIFVRLLHIKDGRFFEKGYRPPYYDDLHWTFTLWFFICHIMTVATVALFAFGVVQWNK